MTRTTIIYAPHPDDEVLRLTAYIMAARVRGDNMMLVAVTDGGATGVRHELGFSVQEVAAVRRSEQAAAWNYLTRGHNIVRLGIEDGEVDHASARRKITEFAESAEMRYAPDVEHYCACRYDDYHADHRAVAEAVAAAHPRVVRFAQPVDHPTGGGTKYEVPVGYEWSAQRAAEAYKEVGWTSVPASFDALRERGYASYTTH